MLLSDNPQEWTREELDDIIQQGVDAHNALAKQLGEDITNLSNIATKVGRYRQLRAQLDEQENNR